MIAFDTDVFGLLLAGDPTLVARARANADADQWITIVVAEEILRGRLNAIRRADSSAGKRSIKRAYQMLSLSLAQLVQMKLLPYTPAAKALVDQWRAQKIRIGTRDLRIAAICFAHQATLVTRNKRDFDQVPGLVVEYW